MTKMKLTTLRTVGGFWISRAMSRKLISMVLLGYQVFIYLKTFGEVAIFFEPDIDTRVDPDELRIQWRAYI